MFPRYQKNSSRQVICGKKRDLSNNNRLTLLFTIISFLTFILLHSALIGQNYDRNLVNSIVKKDSDVSSDMHRISIIQKKIDASQQRIEQLKSTYENFQPKRPYIIVNTAANQIRVVKDGQTIHRGICSTGSYILLKASGQREWLFKTPRGKFRVTVKLKDPWWYKPDWAYVEEGLPIPSKESRKRYQPNVLGDYALGFGSGYLIHGTLYTRQLGLPVTHGCVRLADEDMKLVFDTLTHGSHVYVY